MGEDGGTDVQTWEHTGDGRTRDSATQLDVTCSPLFLLCPRKSSRRVNFEMRRTDELYIRSDLTSHTWDISKRDLRHSDT